MSVFIHRVRRALNPTYRTVAEAVDLTSFRLRSSEGLGKGLCGTLELGAWFARTVTEAVNLSSVRLSLWHGLRSRDSVD